MLFGRNQPENKEFADKSRFMTCHATLRSIGVSGPGTQYLTRTYMRLPYAELKIVESIPLFWESRNE
ncbi:hypothetical protein WM40_10350 [Robbsia andropogonis]|uniref:Uncharacterized protein n=1 Tax=Robbsia andropogonis TaxID=28092 RepID=A0A0F5K0T8_9BURK|nr:hypothetical protein WM40_10350 [Robbsia andropogonis]